MGAMRGTWVGVPVATLSVVWAAYQANPLYHRWVGTHQNSPLHLDFYGDTMVVLNDSLPLWFRAAGDSLMVWGDTTFGVQYWFAGGRLLLLTADGDVVTMARQDELARPIMGDWSGSPIGRRDTIELVMQRGGVARWRRAPGGQWTHGEWSRRTRFIAFTWEPDSATWEGRYDPRGSALLFDSTYAESGTVVLRKVFRP